MYLGSFFLLLGVSIFPVFAGKIPDQKQRSLLNVVQPIYHLDVDARLKAFSEALLKLKDNSDSVTSDALRKLKPSLISEHFNGYRQSHKRDLKEVASVLENAPDFDSFIQRAKILRNFVNPTTYNFALKTALLAREDVSDLWDPPLWQSISRSFFTKEAISHAIKQTRGNAPNGKIAEFSTGTFADPEHRMAWFREDIGLNDMHVSVSIAYVASNKEIDIFHLITQILSRYDAERLAAGLPRVAELKWKWSRQDAVIAEGYDPHLSINLGEKSFAARPANMKIQDDLRYPDEHHTVEQFTYLAQKIEDNIRTGFMTDEKGEQVPMTKELLDDMMKGTREQGMHYFGHQLLSAVTDPDGRYQQEIGVIGAQETAMRDPLFYRYHRLIYNFYDMYQMSLPAYSESDFEFPGIHVHSVKVKSVANPQEDVLETFMENAEANILYDSTLNDHLSKDSETRLKIPYERLNHDDFEYLINVHNNKTSGDDVKAVVRIFIAPHNDETKMPFRSLNDQRRFFIEMDKFVTTLKPGTNFIQRSSVLSSVSLPSFETYEQWKDFVNTRGGLHRERITGWPSHLLLPRGTAEGMDFDLVIMVTDWEKDRAESVDIKMVPNLDFGSSISGVKGAAYPDNKSRGFPFDRNFDGYKALADFAGKCANIYGGKLKIVHKK